MRRLGKISPFLLGMWLLGATLARSFAFPNEFAKAHWLIDYRFGFTKRGLIGSILTLLDRLGIVSRSEHTIVVLAFASTIMVYALFFVIAARLFRQTNGESYAHFIVYVVMASPFVVTSGHFFGYFDPIIIIISFVCVYLTIHERPILCSLLTIIALLIHENFLVIGFPLLLFATYSVQSQSGAPRKAATFYPLGTVIVTFSILFVADALFIDKDQLRANLQAQFMHSGFITGDWPRLIAEWLTTSMDEYARDQIYAFYARIFNIHITLMILPSVLTILFFIKERYATPRRAKMMLYASCATFAPILLHLVAWDTQRISAYTIVTALGCLWICAQTLPAVQPAASPSLTSQLMLGMALLASCFMRLPLMDGEVDGLSTGVRIGFYAPVFMTLLMYYLSWNRRQRLARVQMWLGAKRAAEGVLPPG